MTMPAMYFKSPLPKILGGSNNWDAVTLPPIVQVPPFSIIGGIHFKDKAKDVSDKLFKHEFKHWYQYLEMCQVQVPGTPLNLGHFYYPIFLGSYALQGYEGSKLELQARLYAKQPLTVVEKKWVELAKKLNP